MLWFRQCPRCRGDLHKDHDLYGEFVSCIQCGYYLADHEIELLVSTGRLEAGHRKQRERVPVLVA